MFEGTESTYAIKEMHMHPYYDALTNDNDIALIRIEGPMEYRTEVSPVCLPDADVAAGTECVATGWGDTKGENTWIFPFPIVFLSIFTCFSQHSCVTLEAMVYVISRIF